METIKKEVVERIYKKPATKKHDALNTVQGSALYYTYTSLYTGKLYRVILYTYA